MIHSRQQSLACSLHPFIPYFQALLTKLWCVGFAGPRTGSLDVKLNGAVPVADLGLDVLCEHCPVQRVIPEATADVKRTTVPKQPAEKFHSHEICSDEKHRKHQYILLINNTSSFLKRISRKHVLIALYCTVLE